MERVVYEYKIITGADAEDVERQVREYVHLQKGWAQL